MYDIHAPLREVRFRDTQSNPGDLLRKLFGPLLAEREVTDSQYVGDSQHVVFGVAGSPFCAPVISQILKDPHVLRYFQSHWEGGSSVLLLADGPSGAFSVYLKGKLGETTAIPPSEVRAAISGVLRGVAGWAGYLDEQGNHVIDLKSPSPGPHFFVNVLLGRRIGFAKPLQTTPKSVVDRLGRGSFRSHAATQVLATRWDMRPEENGFPANRQFYLVEHGRQIFYSADPADSNVDWARAVHAPNHTTITYRTRCGLEIERTIFLLPYADGEPLAVEVQSINVANRTEAPRTLKLVTTGMFGPAAPGALVQDVVYSAVSMESRVLKRVDGSIAAISPHYHPAWAQQDVRFHSMVLHQGRQTFYPREFSTSYNEFVGLGTLEHPDGLSQLSNRLSQKGPGFFALATGLTLPAGGTARADNFTGLVSGILDDSLGEEPLTEQVQRLLGRYSDPLAVDRALSGVVEHLDRYRGYLQIRTDDPDHDRYVNRNLPFQILYQTFVSRSFDQTQKGHREIGFREVQDLFSSMPSLIAMGHQQFAKDLLKEWAGQVFEMGYAYHNFYWQGKEPGDFSDDGLWLAQAIEIYLDQTGDFAFLDETCPIAGAETGRERTVFETLRAILIYSGQISVGKHGLPLLDGADWNDTLRIDPDYLNGPQKEAAYREQMARGGTYGEPFESDYSESVMNAFLLKIALDATSRMARHRGEDLYVAELQQRSQTLQHDLQRHAWKGDFFARVLINKFPDGRYTFLGAGGDGLSADPSLPGSYFLNSFTWSILAGVASEEQIRTMLRAIKQYLLTPFGLKLCSPVRYSGLMAERGGSGEYFQGDRENGGVFKHADMMAAVALLEAAKQVSDRTLAAELSQLAYQVIDVVLPYRTLQNPYLLAGNPRYCTQYNNSETGENVGPILSGTSTWLWLALLSAYGLTIRPEGVSINPLLRDDQRLCQLTLNTGRARYEISIRKEAGFSRVRDHRPSVSVDGQPQESNLVPHFSDGKVHLISVDFREKVVDNPLLSETDQIAAYD